MVEQHQAFTSTASILGHPIHPMIVPLPITFLAAAFVTDLAWWGTGDDFWARVSLWMIGAGVVTGLLAGVVGAIDFATIAHARKGSSGWIHALGNVAALVLAGINWLLRLGDMTDAIVPWGLVLSALVALLLVVTGWYGGELAYRHRIGVIGHD